MAALASPKYELTNAELEVLQNVLANASAEDFQKIAEKLSMSIRAMDGRPVDPSDVITRLTDVKNILERSRFPTYPILQKQVYLRLMAKLLPGAEICETWANRDAEALISYKGQSREEYTEQMKAASGVGEQQTMFFGQNPMQEPPKKKGRFWRRKPQGEETEFIE